MWSPHDLGMGGGGRVNQLILQAGRWGKVWRGGKVQVDCGECLWGKGRALMKREHLLIKGARPFKERGALVACLVGGLVISSFSFMQLRVDDN